MSSRTRKRLLAAGATLFAEHGFRGASVRDICNLAGANPGAVSYHFGGKRQLYRAALRQAAADLARLERDPGHADPADPVDVAVAIVERLRRDPTAARLLLRDLADGGELALEALVPPLRTAFDRLVSAFGESDPVAERAARIRILTVAAPVVVIATASPILCRALDLEATELDELLMSVLGVNR